MCILILPFYFLHGLLQVAYATLGSDGTATLSSVQIPLIQSLISTAAASDAKVFLAGMALSYKLQCILTDDL